ncbi:MAG: family 43 glycosylhydrolase [Haloarculaceae archaeon]
MRRRELLAGSLGSAVAALAGCPDSLAGDGGTPEATYENPVFEPILADPTVVRTPDGTFYAYGTEDNWRDGEGFRYVPLVRSADLVDWEYVGEAFETKPDWKDRGFLWAPAVVRLNGTYHMYYSYSEWGDPNPGIGLATSDDPAGPFEDRGKLFLSDEIGVPNSIDPMVCFEDGTPYLFWGSFNGIYAVELSADGREVVGEKTRVAGDDYEGTYIHERDGQYYFFGSVGSCCDGVFSTYHVRVGRSDSLLGPYEDPDGTDLRETLGPVVVEEGNGFVGPGHTTLVTDDAGREWLLYHAYEEDRGFIGETPRRPLLLDRLRWEDGWPRLPDRTPSQEAHVPTVE